MIVKPCRRGVAGDLHSTGKWAGIAVTPLSIFAAANSNACHWQTPSRFHGDRREGPLTIRPSAAPPAVRRAEFPYRAGLLAGVHMDTVHHGHRRRHPPDASGRRWACARRTNRRHVNFVGLATVRSAIPRPPFPVRDLPAASIARNVVDQGVKPARPPICAPRGQRHRHARSPYSLPPEYPHDPTTAR
jgi:hypothetical protein